MDIFISFFEKYVPEFDDPILSGIEVESSPQFSQDINKSNLGGFDYLNGLEENFLALIVGKPMVLNKFMIFFDKYVGFVALIILCLFLISRVKKDRNISWEDDTTKAKLSQFSSDSDEKQDFGWKL